MNRCIILYKSKYGATKKYAHWLSEALEVPYRSLDAVTAVDLESYDTVVIGGGIYATQYSPLSFVKAYYKYLKHKQLVFFAVGAAAASEAYADFLFNQNIRNFFEDVPFVYMRGAFVRTRLTQKDKILSALISKGALKKPLAFQSSWERALIEAATEDGDWIDPSALKPLIECVADVRTQATTVQHSGSI